MKKQILKNVNLELFNCTKNDNITTLTKQINENENLKIIIDNNDTKRRKSLLVKIEILKQDKLLTKVSLYLDCNYMYTGYETSEGNFEENDNNMKRSLELDTDDEMVELVESSVHKYDQGYSLYTKQKKYTTKRFDENYKNEKIVEIVLSKRVVELLDYVVEEIKSYEPQLVDNLLEIYPLYEDIKYCEVRENCEDVELLINEECNLPTNPKIKEYK